MGELGIPTDITEQVLQLISKKYKKQLEELEMENIKVYQFPNGEYTVDWDNDCTPEDIENERCISNSIAGIVENIEIDIDIMMR